LKHVLLAGLACNVEKLHEISFDFFRTHPEKIEKLKKTARKNLGLLLAEDLDGNGASPGINICFNKHRDCHVPKSNFSVNHWQTPVWRHKHRT
jgi:hypothetical protein